MLPPYLPHGFCFTPFIFRGAGGMVLCLINPQLLTLLAAPALIAFLSSLSQPMLPISFHSDFPGHLMAGKVQLGSGFWPG